MANLYYTYPNGTKALIPTYRDIKETHYLFLLGFLYKLNIKSTNLWEKY